MLAVGILGISPAASFACAATSVGMTGGESAVLNGKTLDYFASSSECAKNEVDCQNRVVHCQNCHMGTQQNTYHGDTEARRKPGSGDLAIGELSLIETTAEGGCATQHRLG